MQGMRYASIDEWQLREHCWLIRLSSEGGNNNGNVIAKGLVEPLSNDEVEVRGDL